MFKVIIMVLFPSFNLLLSIRILNGTCNLIVLWRLMFCIKLANDVDNVALRLEVNASPKNKKKINWAFFVDKIYRNSLTHNVAKCIYVVYQSNHKAKPLRIFWMSEKKVFVHDASGIFIPISAYVLHKSLNIQTIYWIKTKIPWFFFLENREQITLCYYLHCAWLSRWHSNEIQTKARH